MKTRSWRILSGIMVAVVAIAIWSCTDNNVVAPDLDNSGALSDYQASEPITTTLQVTPYIIPGDNNGGNRTCDEVQSAINFDRVTGDVEDYVVFNNSSDRRDYENGIFVNDKKEPHPDGNTFGPITVTVIDGKFINWTSSVPVVVAFIVKGSNEANIYFYSTCSSGDTGLASPINASGGSAGLSNLTVCWTICEEKKDCYDDETAWAATSAGQGRYTNKGNWATWVMGSGNYSLFAGQTMNAGTVSVSAPSGGFVTITINLTGPWMFDPNTDESVKIQQYGGTKAPSGNPSPGLFANKFDASGTTWSGQVPVGTWYGIHADLVRKVDCPE